MFLILDYFGDNINIVNKKEGSDTPATFNTLKEAEEYAQDVQHPQIVNTNVSKAIFDDLDMMEITRIALSTRNSNDTGEDFTYDDDLKDTKEIFDEYMKTKFKEKYENAE